VKLAMITVPFILLTQFLRAVELSEAIRDGHFVNKELLLLDFRLF